MLPPVRLTPHKLHERGKIVALDELLTHFTSLIRMCGCHTSLKMVSPSPRKQNATRLHAE
jgi:hypothetical protein